MAHDVFISYSSKNKPVADAICSALEQREVRCWIAPRDVPPGGNYGEAIVHAIAGCQVVVLVYSSAVNFSAAVMREAERAMHHAKPIIPFRLEDVPMQPGLEFFLASCHWLDAIDPPMEAHLRRLGDAVGALMGREVAAPSPMPAPAKRKHPQWWPVALGVIAAAAVLGGFVLMKSGPAPEKEASPATAAAGPSMDVSLAGASEEVIAGHFRKPAPGRVRPVATRDGGVLSIRPLPADGIPVLAADASGRHFAVEPVQLEFKIAHPGSGTIYLHTATLAVETSEPDPAPRWFLDAAGLPAFAELAGGPPAGATLRHLLAGPEDPGDLSAAAPVPVPASGRMRLDLQPGKSLLGEVTGPDGRAVSFELPAGQAKPGPAAPADPPKEPAYAITLKDAGSRYEVTTNLSQYLRGGEGDRFYLTLDAPLSSRHRFRVKLAYDDGSGSPNHLESGPVEVGFFREKQLNPGTRSPGGRR